MTLDEVSSAISRLCKEYNLKQPATCRRETERGWRVVFHLPCDDAHRVIPLAASWAIALGAPLQYGDTRVFGDWEIQDYTAEGRIGKHISAEIRVVGILGPIDAPVDAEDVAEMLEFAA
jgi:hypothetical protein